MNAGDSPVDDLTPAERGLVQHLELLRASPPVGAAGLVPRVIRGVRWQRAIRNPLLLVGSIAMAVSEGFGLLLRGPEDES
jgi:hypothetical protein